MADHAAFLTTSTLCSLVYPSVRDTNTGMLPTGFTMVKMAARAESPNVMISTRLDIV